MKVLLALHGYPPELVGGTEDSTRALARALAAAGHEPVVVAGSMQWEGGLRRSLEEDADPASGRSYRVHRIHRADPYFDHWQKGAAPAAGRLFEEVLDEERPDLVHVHHWIRLSRDLVWRAARRGVPAVATLHDLWATCLVAFRVHPAERAFCRRPLDPAHCLDCAAHVPPRTPWLDAEAQAAEVRAHRRDLARELDLARAVVAPSRTHAEAALGWLGLDPGATTVRVVPPARSGGVGTSGGPRPVPAAFTPDAPLVLTCFGQWSELKGTDLLLDAAARVAAAQDAPGRLRLLLAGGAPFPAFAARVEALAADARRDHGLDVRLLGAYEREALADHPVADAHLFVHPTRAHESWGLVLDEALDLGLGVVAPDLGAPAERLADARAAGDGWGEPYAPGDAADLARLLGELLEDPPRVAALGAAAREAVAAGRPAGRARALDEVLAAHLEVYRAALEAGPVGPDEVPPPAEDPADREAWLAAWDAALGRHTPEELGQA